MKVLHLAVVGFGKLGRSCVQAINEDEQSVLAGIVRQRGYVAQKLPAGFENMPVAGHITELEHVDAATTHSHQVSSHSIKPQLSSVILITGKRKAWSERPLVADLPQAHQRQPSEH